jgi:hypothetical protein
MQPQKSLAIFGSIAKSIFPNPLQIIQQEINDNTIKEESNISSDNNNINNTNTIITGDEEENAWEDDVNNVSCGNIIRAISSLSMVLPNIIAQNICSNIEILPDSESSDDDDDDDDDVDDDKSDIINNNNNKDNKLEEVQSNSISYQIRSNKIIEYITKKCGNTLQKVGISLRKTNNETTTNIKSICENKNYPTSILTSTSTPSISSPISSDTYNNFSIAKQFRQNLKKRKIETLILNHNLQSSLQKPVLSLPIPIVTPASTTTCGFPPPPPRPQSFPPPPLAPGYIQQSALVENPPLPPPLPPCRFSKSNHSNIDNSNNMKVTFLGTGSATPSKHRNNSSIMIQSNPCVDNDSSIGQNDNTTILLDIGEGTCSQIYLSVSGKKLSIYLSIFQFSYLFIHLYIFFEYLDNISIFLMIGNKLIYDRLLSSISLIWISHHHADHICGFPMLLEHILRARIAINRLNKTKTIYKKILVICPLTVQKYYEFTTCVSGLDDLIEFLLIGWILIISIF